MDRILGYGLPRSKPSLNRIPHTIPFQHVLYVLITWGILFGDRFFPGGFSLDDFIFSKFIMVNPICSQSGQLVFLCDLLHYHQPAHTLRSSSQLLLYQPATRINFQSKAFSITTPAVWNSLSPVTKSSTTITTFKAHLKTELFAAAYDTV